MSSWVPVMVGRLLLLLALREGGACVVEVGGMLGWPDVSPVGWFGWLVWLDITAWEGVLVAADGAEMKVA